MSILQRVKVIIAIIYCRVSSDRQVKEGHGLEAQELRCRNYAKVKGYPVFAVFMDEGISGATNSRKGMDALLQALGDVPKDAEVVVIVDDIKRFARDVTVHHELKRQLTEKGARLESPSMEFTDTAVGHYVENMMAAGAQWEREQNAEQVKNRMAARLLRGCYPFSHRNYGYRINKHPLHGKIPHRFESEATIVIEGLEGFATGRFPTVAALQQFFGRMRLNGTDFIKHDAVTSILKRSWLYAAYVQYEPWSVPLTKAVHEPLISFETHLRIQERLAGKHRTHVHQKNNPLYPLRGFVHCTHCKMPYTGSKSKGNGGKYPYYRGRGQKGQCACSGKSVRTEIVHEQMANVLKDVKPDERTVSMTRDIAKALWQEKIKTLEARTANAQRRMHEIDEQVRSLARQVGQARSTAVKQAYERQIEELEAERIQHVELVEGTEEQPRNFETCLDEVLQFIQEPHKRWVEGGLAKQQQVIRMVFIKPLMHNLHSSFETTDLSLTYAIIAKKNVDDSEMVHPTGFEPVTVGLKGHCSTN